jgi:hypothetical protein
MEVLKAQAIAARTYAINYTNNGAKLFVQLKVVKLLEKVKNRSMEAGC